jgi:hypothetical protein
MPGCCPPTPPIPSNRMGAGGSGNIDIR